MNAEPNFENELESLELSSQNQASSLSSNQCFLKKKMNFINGFVLEFNIAKITEGSLNEGFAVVL